MREKIEEFKQTNVEQWDSLKEARAKLVTELPALLEASANEWIEAHTVQVEVPAPEDEAAAEPDAEDGAAEAEPEAAAAEPVVPEEPAQEKRLREAIVKLKAVTGMINELAEHVDSIAERVDDPPAQWKVLQTILKFVHIEPAETWPECQAGCKGLVLDKLVAPDVQHML